MQNLMSFSYYVSILGKVGRVQIIELGALERYCVEELLFGQLAQISMDPVSLARNLLSNVESFVQQSVLSSSERFELREKIRVEAKKIVYAIDGPEQALRTITRGVRKLPVLCCRTAKMSSTRAPLL